MKPRNPLNSKILKNRFPKIYSQFFSKCQLVVSAPHFFTWAGEYVGYWGGMTLMQKIPLRIYVGLELIPGSKNKEEGITISDDACSYSIKEDKFRPDQYDHLVEQRLLRFLKDIVQLKRKGRNIKLHILSELPLAGSGSTGALSSALAALLALENQALTPNEIKKWENYSSQDLIQKKNLKFDFLFRLAWKISAAYRGEYTSGAVIFNVILPSAMPVFYCTIGEKESEIEADSEIFDRVPIWGGKVEELFNLKKVPSWPIDFALVSLGEPRGISPFSTQELRDTFKETNKFINKNLKEFFKLEKNRNPLFPSKNNIWQATLQLMNTLNIRILMELGKLLKEGAREDVLRGFLQAVDRYQILFLLLGFNPPQVKILDSIIHQEARQVDDLGAGVKSVSTTKKGIILFALPHGRIRQVIEPVISRVKKELNLDLQIIYASWLDGIENEGVKVEQYLDQKIYSQFISKNTIQIKDFSQKTGSNFLLCPEEFNQRKKKIDLLLVEKEGKIYIQGKPLTSKELHSQKATINILKILLQKIDQEVPNNELPQSSYANDRYELQGKIVTPLIKTIEKRTKKKLDLKIKGGVVDFSLRLNPGPIKIWLI